MADARAAYLRTLVLAALIGVPIAFAAVLFQTALHDITDLVWDEIPDWLGQSEPAGWYVVLVPALAGLIVAQRCSRRSSLESRPPMSRRLGCWRP
jgi:H+/Cl- antiporter ClcA